jgi:hypothetical protein
MPGGHSRILALGKELDLERFSRATRPGGHLPDGDLYSREGVDVALICVEVWSAGVIVRLAGLPNERTEALDRHYHETLDAWAHAGRAGSPPKQPAEDVFDIDLALSDDSGTS